MDRWKMGRLYVNSPNRSWLLYGAWEALAMIRFLMWAVDGCTLDNLRLIGLRDRGQLT